ncbi:hypothetical protein Nepgr_011187 [Nepenthes gracilis]|uniref:DUF7722 domain-containing protein n=1 Tax=Nepenthes gracilis TaxID=150966 RepID=A0AAD3XM55_NEPGR|nr:hypothetical protein Nepgr_011187 [Nepenthes gracilis]
MANELMSYGNSLSTQGSMPNGQRQLLGLNKSHHHHNEPHLQQQKYCFQMPLHYPRYKKRDYETMPEVKLDRLLMEYGLPITGNVDEKRNFAMGAFLWPSQMNEST